MRFSSPLIKKVVVADEHATPAARAERLRRLRNLSNLSRQQLCERAELNINTVKRWELGQYGGLPRDGATKVIAQVAREGVQCSLEWLLYGTEPSPQLMSRNRVPPPIQPLDAIEQELALFYQHHVDAVDLSVSDDAMLPVYQRGDRVAGVQHYQAAIKTILDQVCIVKTPLGETLLRVVRAGETDSTYTLVCLNSLANIPEPVRYHARLISAAPVVRVYRPVSPR